ncbi:MAG: 3-oxoacyl-[acyl-carrier-protein] reductase [Rhodospirillales bacterium]|nr:3-oxoacyl-[acyl-carrier-protein] reductase [Rhodospirillales bacterium]
MFDLSGKSALVTGASGGIGGAAARALKARGAAVALSDVRPEGLEQLAQELGDGAHAIPCDLGDGAAIEALAKDAEAALGGIDILINNAGLTRDNLMLRMKDEEWQQILDINLTAAFRLTRACLRPMMKRRWGRVIGLASVVGVTGNAGQANYGASKAALIGMTKSLAREVASRNITANCVAPGFIATPMTDGLNDDVKARLLADIPGGRLGTAQEIAASIVFLASDEAAYITGQTLHVNGGMAMI